MLASARGNLEVPIGHTRAAASTAARYGIKVGLEPVCPGHTAPAEVLASWMFHRPHNSVLVANRGGGKSFLRGFATHFNSGVHQGFHTRILGGSKAQSEQIYNALRTFEANDEATSSAFQYVNKTEASYRNGSQVSILAASPTSVRGPHVPDLCLDEVDEIKPEIRDASYGMAMDIGGHHASITHTSTWHKVGGPMSELIERAKAQRFPLWTFCVFEVLERCPDSRSGPGLERCPECPIFKWCHEGKEDAGGLPKAKRSNGHYTIDALIQKLEIASFRIFEADYLCLRPRADGIWFTEFDKANIQPVEYNPDFPVHVSIDSNVWTGAVAFQVITDRWSKAFKVHVLGEYLTEGVSAEGNAVAMVAWISEQFPDAHRKRRIRVSTDPSGSHRNAIGPTVIGEYLRVGLRGYNGIEMWPVGTLVADALKFVELLVKAASGDRFLLVHPRCLHTINAMQGYERAKRGGQYIDQPKDPQHPHEDLVDALKGGLKLEFPDSRLPAPDLILRPASHVF